MEHKIRMESVFDSCRQICRLCIKTDDVILHPIYDEPFIYEFDFPLPLRIMACTGLDVYPYDGLPQLICHRCMYNINHFYRFKEKCELSDKFLRAEKETEEEKMRTKRKRKIILTESPDEIKTEEVKEEDDDDDDDDDDYDDEDDLVDDINKAYYEQENELPNVANISDSKELHKQESLSSSLSKEQNFEIKHNLSQVDASMTSPILVNSQSEINLDAQELMTEVQNFGNQDGISVTDLTAPSIKETALRQNPQRGTEMVACGISVQVSESNANCVDFVENSDSNNVLRCRLEKSLSKPCSQTLTELSVHKPSSSKQVYDVTCNTSLILHSDQRNVISPKHQMSTFIDLCGISDQNMFTGSTKKETVLRQNPQLDAEVITYKTLSPVQISGSDENSVDFLQILDPKNLQRHRSAKSLSIPCPEAGIELSTHEPSSKRVCEVTHNTPVILHSDNRKVISPKLLNSTEKSNFETFDNGPVATSSETKYPVLKMKSRYEVLNMKVLEKQYKATKNTITKLTDTSVDAQAALKRQCVGNEQQERDNENEEENSRDGLTKGGHKETTRRSSRMMKKRSSDEVLAMELAIMEQHKKYVSPRKRRRKCRTLNPDTISIDVEAAIKQQREEYEMACKVKRASQKEYPDETNNAEEIIKKKGKNYQVLNSPNKHLIEKYQTCPICDIVCRKKAFNDHFIAHSVDNAEDNKFTCLICQKAFKVKFSLMRHMLIHSAVKPYKCSKCNRTFSDTSNLIKHERSHNDIRPYVCQFCNAAYTDNSYLLKHMRNHHSKVNVTDANWKVIPPSTDHDCYTKREKRVRRPRYRNIKLIRQVEETTNKIGITSTESTEDMEDIIIALEDESTPVLIEEECIDNDFIVVDEVIVGQFV
ncbi:uncharacterized protein [Periplaneta americana]|uniref:uncharacterized protein n=1 Tax=Periplaneta americana TaxID=6978 RepID=UPI0037E8710E